MHNSYSSSTISLRSKGYLPFSFNDYCNFLNERIENTSSSYCACCDFSIHRAPINPSFLYGLRQSTLIRCSASRTLILSGGDRYFRLPLYQIDRGYGVFCSLQEKGISSRRRRKGSMVWKEKSERCDSGIDGSAEAMLSLLTEQIDEKCVGVEERAYGRAWVEKRGDSVKECSREEKENFESDFLEINSKYKFEFDTIKSREEGKRWSGGRECYSRSGNFGARKDVSSCSPYCSVSFSGDIESDADVTDKIEKSDADVQVKHGGFSGEYSSGYKKELGKKREKAFGRKIMEQFKRHGDDIGGNGEFSIQGNVAVGSYAMGSGVEWDSRNKAGKNFTEVLAGQIKSRDQSSKKDSKISKVHGSATESVSNSHNQFNGKEENFNLDVNLVEETREQHSQTGNQVTERSESRRKSQQITEMSETHDSDFEMVSSPQKRLSVREGNITAAANPVQETRDRHSQRVHRIIGQNESRRKSQQLTQMSEIHDSDIEITSTSQRQPETKMKKMNEYSTSVLSSVSQGKEQCTQRGQQNIGEIKSRGKSQQLTETSKIRDSDIQKISTSQRHSETEMKNWEESSTSILPLAQKAKDQRTQTSHEVLGRTELRKESQDVTNISVVRARDTEIGTNAQRLSDKRISSREGNFTSVVDLADETKERRSQTGQTNHEVLGRTELRKESQDVTNISVVCAHDTEIGTNAQRLSDKRISSREGDFTSVVDLAEEAKESHRQTGERVFEQIVSKEESRRPIKRSSFLDNASERASSSQTSLNSVRQSREQQIGAWKEDETNSQVMVMPPPSQLVARGSPDAEPTTGYTTQEFYSETSESGSSALYTNPQGRSPTLRDEQDDGTKRDENYDETSNLIFREDALGSANRLEKSSTQFVGEFIEKLRHEISTSESQKERKSSKTTWVYEDEKQQGLSQRVSEDFGSKVHGLRRSSADSGTKGPLDKMWDVADPSFQEPPRTEAPEEGTPTTGGAIVRRTSRTLWSVIADIVRMRWGAHAETHNSAMKSGGRSSSNESVGSEVWFSGHEPDENYDENVKRGRRGMPKEPISADQPQLGKTPDESRGEVFDTVSSQDKISQVEANIGSASKGTSLTSLEENFDWNEDEKRGRRIRSNSSIALSDSLLPLPDKRSRRSPVIEQTSESSKVELSRSGFMDQVEHPVGERLTEASGTEGKDGDLKRRKLQRNKQVLKERFDQWEEAYKSESEQRKIDEMFMREALLEAKKAADTWEVPVGAVLVQHGKIIARGSNLVEELRDSTAHAEMICIREASNLLWTWRLAETTLYVTLEPCPMCAGAVLQARIDTVVWGAPNKLLGADGSWVRLFPSGVEGGSGSDLTNQPAGPVHPFHPNMKIRRGVLATECADVMQQFFQLRRKKEEKKVKTEPPATPSCLPVSTHPSKLKAKMHDIFGIMFCL